MTQSAVNTAAARTAQARDALTDTELRAPFDGVIADRMKEKQKIDFVDIEQMNAAMTAALTKGDNIMDKDNLDVVSIVMAHLQPLDKCMAASEHNLDMYIKLHRASCNNAKK